MNKEQLHYKVADKVIAELLGRQNFSAKESAVLEVVKNAYDAGANRLEIYFLNNSPSSILFIDDGVGMNKFEIESSWMLVGESNKGYTNKRTDRVYAGSKGIGRFALARLGEEVYLKTRKDNQVPIVWETDWKNSYVSEISNTLINKGTTIEVRKLRDRWNRKSIKNLQAYLSRTYNDDTMQIIIYYNGEQFYVKTNWNDYKIGETHTSYISLSYDSNTFKLSINIENDEFKSSVKNIYDKHNINHYTIEIDVIDHLMKDVSVLLLNEIDNLNENDIKDEVKLIFGEVGNFFANLYFNLSSGTLRDKELYEYKYNRTKPKNNLDIILYRNAFSVDSFDGSNDWLELSKRAQKSPAAASHSTGNWRVRSNQLSGYVTIDKNENSFIEDLSNRQGIVKNIHFKIFKLIMLLGISQFERYRQSIIRGILEHKKNNEIKIDTNVDVKKILNNIKSNIDNSDNTIIKNIEMVIQQVEQREKENERIKEEKKEIEKKARYESQLLNVLATSQLKVNALGHEIKNNQNNIAHAPKDLEDAIKEHIDWEELEDESIPKFKNIPKIIHELKNNTKTILNLTNTILEEMEKERFISKNYTLKELMEEITEKWKLQYNWIDIQLDANEEDIKISYDNFMVIFDNLILNSIQQNEDYSALIIKIKFEKEDLRLNFSYEDNGKGLHEKYKKDPMMILEVHESTRLKGHGLGMWMVNNTINQLNGKIENINGENKFFLQGYIKVGK